MKKLKLFKTLFIPSLGVLALGTIAAVSTSCGSKNSEGQSEGECVVLTANADSTVELINNNENNPDLSYSTDLTNWNTYSTQIRINKDQTYYLKGNNPNGWSTSYSNYSYFSITGDVSISGNVMGLLDNGAMPGKQEDISAIPCNYCFLNLFENSAGITSVSEDFLPATTLAEHCYPQMFQGCANLRNAPELPATELAEGCYSYMFDECASLTAAPNLPATALVENCYEYMFENCTTLTEVPTLPATELAKDCYFGMFDGCTSLTQAPDLPATTLKSSCYYSMFQGCTNLRNAPELPATTLAEGCYVFMFSDCLALKTAPELPATTLAVSCYTYMFSNCSSLNSIKIGYTGTVAEAPSDAFSNWVDGVANTGTFYYNGPSSAQDFGFPSGWGKA